MRFDYVIYPRAQEILKSSGLLARIEKARKKHEISFLGHTMESEIVDWIKEMKTEKWYDSIPEGERKAYFEGLQRIFKERDNGTVHWRVQRKEGEYKEPFEIEDLILLAGCRASHLLKKKEIFDYKKFGFSNVAEMVGTVGAAMEVAIRDDSHRRGLKWQTQRPDGRILVNEITGDTNCDLRIHQNDITPYQTFDPLGNEVHYRPETEPDRGVVAAYHSTEREFFAALLKWVDQVHLSPESLKNNARDTIQWVRSLGQGGGTCAEHFGGYEGSARLPFGGWEADLPQLDADSSTTDWSRFHLVTQTEGSFGFYLGQDNRLVITYDSFKEGKPNPHKKEAVSFMPQEADHAIRGLLYQCAKGLGRTSANQLVNMLEYRYSPKFQTDLDELKRKLGEVK